MNDKYPFDFDFKHMQNWQLFDTIDKGLHHFDRGDLISLIEELAKRLSSEIYA